MWSLWTSGEVLRSAYNARYTRRREEMKNEQESLPMPDKNDLAAPVDPQPTQARKAEGCPYHNGRFSYRCHICNPR